MKTIRWGMIGCGDVAEVKSGPALYKTPNSKLIAVMRRNGELAADYARRHGASRWTTDADEIIHAPDIDAVYIATPTEGHCDYTVRCAAAGKMVYCEKPMAVTHEQCETMIAACERAGVPLWIGYYRRALPRFLAVRDLVQQGAIGEIASYRFASGVYGSGSWCLAADVDEECNEIVGSTGRIRFSTTKPVPIEIIRGESVERRPVADPPHVHQPLVQTIIDEVNGRGTCPSTGRSAARTARVMDAILGEFRSSRRANVVFSRSAEAMHG
ncbi:MAG TPA: Gfo/Idh/MocA family oxidoreductase [Casimicrobiaceae bacterium]|nr:Gfo/Idh/MocA family oxidoreductase [Casimicrobiaceae bacterium]